MKDFPVSSASPRPARLWRPECHRCCQHPQKQKTPQSRFGFGYGDGTPGVFDLRFTDDFLLYSIFEIKINIQM